MSRNVPESLPSRNATSGSISSDDASELAFLAMRCDSTASWFVYSISRRLPPPCPICADACCASSSSALLPELSVSRPLASVVRLVSLASSRSAARSTRSQRALTSFRSLTVVSSCAMSRLTPRDRAAVQQRLEVGLESLAAVLHRGERAGLALRGQRAAARQPLRQHLHFRRRRRRRGALRRLPCRRGTPSARRTPGTSPSGRRASGTA